MALMRTPALLAGGLPRYWPVLLAALLLTAPLVLAAPAQAKEPQITPAGQEIRVARKVEPMAPPRLPHPGGGMFPGPGSQSVFFKHLPRGHVVLRHHNQEFYYHHGHFFRHNDRGFFPFHPPAGVVVPMLPPGYTRIIVRGSPYYFYHGIYYIDGPGGYVVVAPPPADLLPPPVIAPTPAAPYGTISVTAPSLNVRSGPGRAYGVVAVVQQGDLYPVYATAPGWLYIRLPDGQYGWVEQAFTAPATASPSG